MFYNTLFRRLGPKLYSITILRIVLFGEIIWGVGNVYYNICWMGKFKLGHNKAEGTVPVGNALAGPKCFGFY